MKLTTKQRSLVKRFNQPDVHLVISRWPQKGCSYDGIATYTQDTLKRFARKYKAKFIVLAEQQDRVGGQVSKVTKDGDRILVIRAFDEKKFRIYPQVLSWLSLFPKVKQVYVHSEFCASGGPVLRFMVVPFLALIRMAGRKVTFYAHNVVNNLQGYEQHLGMAQKSMEVKLMSLGYRWYFRLLSLMVARFVVLEEVVADRLRALVGSKEVLVEPHWIAPVTRKITQVEARKRLGIKTKTKLVVSFGFVTHYKGADFMARFSEWLMQNKINDMTVVLAGGKAYSLKEKDYYERYYAGIENRANQLPNFQLTGFLSEKDVALWLTAADVVVFPYRNLMGGSGALQQALRYGKPVFLSKKMAEALGVDEGQVMFGHRFSSLYKKLHMYFSDRSYQEKVQQFSDDYADSLSVKTLLPRHYKDVYESDDHEKNWIAEGLVDRLLDWSKQVIYEVVPVKSN